MLLQTGLTAIGLVRSNLSLLLLGINADLLVRLALTLELDDAVNLGVQGIVIADADVVAGMDYGTTLANQNVAGEYELTIGALNAQTLRGRVTAVTRATHTFFMGKQLQIHNHYALPPVLDDDPNKIGILLGNASKPVLGRANQKTRIMLCGFFQLKRKQYMKIPGFVVAFHLRVCAYNFIDAAQRCQENS